MLYNKKYVTRFAQLLGGLVLLLFIVPQTRYVIPKLFINKPLTVHVQDSNGTAVANATVTVGSKQAATDTEGNVTLYSLSVGHKTINAQATYYKTASVDYTQPLFRKPKAVQITLLPVGQLTKVTVLNRITNRPVNGAQVAVQQGGNGKTNAQGTAIIALPSGTQQAIVSVSGDDILRTSSVITPGLTGDQNTVYVTLKGQIAYLQNNAGRLQVMASNLDGTESKVLLDSTGNEDLADTQLIGSSSYKFVALKSRRSATPGIYIIDVVSGKTTTIEESVLSYIPVGWHGEVFVYLVYQKQALWLPGTYQIKAYNALNNQTTTIDTSNAEGNSVLDYASEIYENVFIMPEGIVYAKRWQASYYYGSRLANKRMTITLSDDLGNKSDIQQWQAGYNAYVKTRQTGPRKLSIFVELDGVLRSYYSYTRQTVIQDSSVTEDMFKSTKQDTYFVSPNNLFSVWQKTDSKNYIGTVDATNSLQLQLPQSYKTVGWYGNDYVLLQDVTNSELRIAAREITQKGGNTLKIANVYIAPLSYTVYGYGR